MKKMLKGIAIVVALAIAVLVVLFMVYNEPRPTGKQGAAADELAKKMIAAVNGQAWNRTGAVSWTFRNPHYHIWDKERHLAKVSWENREVLIDINSRRGVILSDTEGMSELDKGELCETAWKYWVNDSFWLNPVVKAFDPGTSRSIVELENGDIGLMVTYASGGATPGDSYLWILDDQYRPMAWKMWVSIIPLGGVSFSWEDWIKTKTGAWIATRHEGLISIPIADVKTADTLAELTGSEDIFQPLFQSDQELIQF
ncbi:MAG: hypothetical protein RIC80_19255 [Cyclobacteriaceae bacterium]